MTLATAPHRPNTKDVRYTLWTEEHDRICESLTPCAAKLYRWLLERAPGGTKQEIDLDDFQEFTQSSRRENGYSRAHILRAWKELIEAGLAIVTRTFGNLKRIAEAIVRHAGEKLVPLDLKRKSYESRENITTETKMLRIEGSNPDDAVPLNREDQSQSESGENSFEEEKESLTASDESLPPEKEEILTKYEKRLSEHGVYRYRRDDQYNRCPNPDFEPILRVVTKVPATAVERGIIAFFRECSSSLAYQMTNKYGNSYYAALEKNIWICDRYDAIARR